MFIIQVSMSGCCGGRDLRCLRGLGFNSCSRVWQDRVVFIIQVSMSGCCGGRDLRCLGV